MMNAALLEDWLNVQGYSYEKNKSAKELCTFKTGGDVAFVVAPGSIPALAALIRFLRENDIRYRVLGNGSNVLFSDKGYDGVIVLTTRLSNTEVEETADGGCITAECGALLNTVCRTALKHELSGLEFAYGIPGTVGGAVYMNAGAYGGEIADVAGSVIYLSAESGEISERVGAKNCFSYRYSIYSDTNDVILACRFSLKKGKGEEINAKMREHLQSRKDKQPLEYPSAGSTFKRYPGRYTGQMIEAAGLKGKRIGGAMVSEKHAGFIINYDHATSNDILALIDHVRSVIAEREQVLIECEVQFIE